MVGEVGGGRCKVVDVEVVIVQEEKECRALLYYDFLDLLLLQISDVSLPAWRWTVSPENQVP